MAATSTAISAPASPKTTRETTDEIIKRIDVVAAYKEAGVTFTADKPRSTGFIECYAFKRDDARPSGYVNTLTGMYGDSTTGEKITFWDFMGAHHPGIPSPGFFSVLKYFAQRAGIEIDTKETHRKKNSYDNPAEVFEWLADNQSHAFLWTFAYRRSTTVDALKYAGCQIAYWRCYNKKPKNGGSGDATKIERVIGKDVVCTVPFYSVGSTDSTEIPAAYQCWNVSGQPLFLYAGKEKPPEPHKILSAGPIRGTLANARAVKWLQESQAIAAATNTTPPAAARVWKTCGPGDMLALLSIIPEHLLNHPTAPHLVTTNGNGESGDCTTEQAKLFTAQNVMIPADADPKGWGMIGAKKWGNALALYTPTIRIFQLFEPTEENKAANRNDLRDWIRERKENPLLTTEEIYAELCELADKAAIYEVEVKAEAEAAATTNPAEQSSQDNTSAIPPTRKKITNQEEIYLGGKSYKRTVKPQQILEDIYSQTGGWPRRLHSQLFWHNEKEGGKIVWITNTASLFSWLHDRCEGLDWHRGTELMNQDQFFQFVRNNATQYESIEYHPQWPHVPNTFYACPMPKEPPAELAGNVIAELLSHFTFESRTDYALATCFVLTLFWGHSGTKPAFAITAKEGRGAGKTTFVDELSALVGGYMDINAQSSSEVIMQRLLSDEGMAARICRIDNIKTNRFSWDALESVITAKFITGKKMWVGEARRANNVIWVMTVNGPSFSTDMSQRSIEIHLKKPEKRVADFLPRLQNFIANNKQEIAGDAIAMLKRVKHDIPVDLQIDGRWSYWFSEIVGRICTEPQRAEEIYSKIMHVTNVRQHGNDDESQDAEEFSAYICNELMKFGYRLNQAVHISHQILAEWYREYSNSRGETRAIVKSLKRSIEQGQITILHENSSHKYARGFVYRDSIDNPAVTDYGLEALFLEFKRSRKYPAVI